VGLPVPNAVVAVLPYFGQAERRALTQTAGSVASTVPRCHDGACFVNFQRSTS
jgi:hypothetical protein